MKHKIRSLYSDLLFLGYGGIPNGYGAKPNGKTVTAFFKSIYNSKYCFMLMTSPSDYKVICFHESFTGYGPTRGGAMRPQPGTTCTVKMCHKI